MLLVLNSLAESTLRKYGKAFKAFQAFADNRASLNNEFAAVYDKETGVMTPHSQQHHFEIKLALTSFFAFSWKYAKKNKSWLESAMGAIKKVHHVHNAPLSDFHTSGASNFIAAIRKTSPAPVLKNPVKVSTIRAWVKEYVKDEPSVDQKRNIGDTYRMMRATILSVLAWYGLLRVSELVPPQLTSANENTKALRVRDMWPMRKGQYFANNDPISWRNADAFSMKIRNSKTDRNGAGFTRIFEEVREKDGGHSDLCPVRLMRMYVNMDREAWVEAEEGNLTLGEVHTRGLGVRRKWRTINMKTVADFVSAEGSKIEGQQKVTSHSLRAGGASALLASGRVDHATIMTLGRWRSTSFLRYIAKAINSTEKDAPEKKMLGGEVILPRS